MKKTIADNGIYTALAEADTWRKESVEMLRTNSGMAGTCVDDAIKDNTNKA
jgi:hypothetical protein